jgi:hypothetical protein
MVEIFWSSLVLSFVFNVLFFKFKNNSLNFGGYLLSLVLSLAVYVGVCWLAAYTLPQYTGQEAAQFIIGASTGWFLSKNLKLALQTNHAVVLTLAPAILWYNLVF